MQLQCPFQVRRPPTALQSKVIHTDDTSIKLLEGKGVAHTAKFWPYLGDADHPYIIFDFTRTRGRDRHAELLRGFEGYLQADAYSGYDGIYAGDKVKEVAYTLNQWEAFCRYTDEGYLSYSNNAAERAVKIPAIGRKNYLFVASATGGCRDAIHYSLVSSAKANGVEPFAWLKDVLSRLPHHRGGKAFAPSRRRQASQF